MAATLVGVLLVVSLLIAEQYSRSHPLRVDRPLDVDEDLPLPWAGHASTVCSLTALFGAYLVILLLIGPAAIVGAALGSVGVLFFMRRVIQGAPAESFEVFLASRRFSLHRPTNELCWALLVVTQAGFAASELLLLREIAVRGLPLTGRHASTFALGVALVGYLYCLRAGYQGVFRTDVVQFFFVAVMCVLFGGYALLYGQFHAVEPLGAGYWTLPPFDGPIASLLCQLGTGVAMGSAFLAASPDAWKRVYVASVNTDGRGGFGALVLAGAVPFVLLTPLVYCLPAQLVAQDIWVFVETLARQRVLALAFVLGLTASFLSSFDSALVGAVHVLLVRSPRAQDIAQYRYRLGVLFLCVTAVVLGLIDVLGNPYLVATMLAGPYAILGGLVLGTRGLVSPARALFWLVAGALVTWVLIVLGTPGILAQPTIIQLGLVPSAVGLFVLMLVASQLRRRST